jgi:hypothetical protein
MKVPEKVGGSAELRQLGGGDASNVSSGVRAAVAPMQVRDRVSPGLLGEAFSQAGARREDRLGQLRRSLADGSYRPDFVATADALGSDAQLVSALRASWED